MHKFLLGLTTTKNSDWREKIEETKRFGITEIALFPTCLAIEDRKELYKLLEDSPIKSVPLVHLRDDQELWELELLSEKYKTHLFNIHPDCGPKAISKFIKYKDCLYIENQRVLDDQYLEMLRLSAGMCVDFSHLEDFGDLRIDHFASYKIFNQLTSKYKIGCAHISAIRFEKFFNNEENEYFHSCHKARNKNELDYIQKYKEILPPISSIELENSFKEQLEYKKYLENMVDK